MTEVPEYLLQRSRERRAALGLETGGPAGTSAGESAATTESQQSAATPSTAVQPSAAAEAAPAAQRPSEAAPTSAAEADPAVAAASARMAAMTRTSIPIWVMPVLVLLPIWGVVYMGAFGDRTVKKALTPREVYAKGGCGSCHGARGEGGSGPELAGGAARLTFPNEEDHVNWVKTGSGAFAGRSYGAPNRPGGPRPPATGGMPGFEGRLTEAEIQAVVQFEREEL